MIYSHPGIPLIHHLKTVGSNAKGLVQNRNLTINIDKHIIAELAYIAGALHDIGKATIFFQHYLLSEDHEIIGPKSHALISALLALKVSQRYIEKTSLEKRDKLLLPYFVFTAVKRHHGRMGNYDNELLKISEKSDELNEQAANFAEGSDLLYRELIPEELSDYSWNDFLKYISEKEFEIELPDFFFEEIEDGFSELPATDKFSYFYLHQLFYSTLLFSDKSDVILKDQGLGKKSKLDYEAIEKFREAKGFDNPAKRIDQLKNEAYFSSIKHLEKVFQPSHHLYSLTLPTGLGKTITSLGVALTLKKLIDNSASKIVVTIPFTSIIDQNYAVFQEIFDSPGSTILLKHHHLAEPSYKEGDDEFDAQKSQFLIETWQSEIVVTTFVQLLETVFTNDKAKLLKLPNLMNAIIILDEVQQINYQLWPLIRQAFSILGEKYNCYFLLMSATQPLIFEPGKEIIEVVPEYERYFSFFNRTKLINRTGKKVSFEEFTEDIVNFLDDYPDKNVLVILNTKQKTRELFEALSQPYSEDSDIFYLSTLITPYERKKIIRSVKNNNGKRRKIVISTQLVEAGVDISVHTVFRAQAPLDSIIQAAGRANRYNESSDPAEVYLYQIDELQKASSMIYGRDLLIKTNNVIKEVEVVEERNFLALIKRYFDEVYKQSMNVTSEIQDAITKLQFETVGNFKLIEEQNSESVFVQLNSTAVELWEKFTSIYSDENLNKFEKKAAFSKIRARFYDYVINVPIPYGQKEIDFDRPKTNYHFYLSELEDPSSYYNYSEEDFTQNTGYYSQQTMNF